MKVFLNWLQPNLITREREGRENSRILLFIMLRQVFSLPLRATEGFLRSLASLLRLKISIPDYTVLSRRSENIKLIKLTANISPGSHIIVDSTGLKVYGQDEWYQAKHKVKPKRTWR